MPWWFWVLLWAVLLLGSAVALACAGYWLVRKSLRVVGDAGESLARVGARASGARIETADDGGNTALDASRPRPGSAVFAEPEDMRRAYQQGKADRQDARRLRRVARRAERGQAQSLRDLGLI